MESPHFADDGDLLIDPHGVSWREVAEWLEPDEVTALVRDGALVSVAECADWRWDCTLDDEIMKDVVTAEESHRRARGKYTRETILAASAWEEDGGSRRLVLLTEENAKKRSVLREFTRLSDLGRPRLRIHKRSKK